MRCTYNSHGGPGVSEGLRLMQFLKREEKEWSNCVQTGPQSGESHEDMNKCESPIRSVPSFTQHMFPGSFVLPQEHWGCFYSVAPLIVPTKRNQIGSL